MPASPAGPEPGPGGLAAVRRTAVSVAVATAAYGVSFGALGTTGGLSVLQTCALSLLMFTGASQFAFVGVLAGGGSPVSAVATAWFLGARNAFYGLQLARTLAVRGPRRLLAAHWVIDESTAQSARHRDPTLARAGFWYGAAFLFVGWNAATLIGAVVGNAIGDPKTYGLDAASSAAFLALLWPRLRTWALRAVAVAAAALATGLVPVVPTGVPVLVAGLVAVVAGIAGAGAEPAAPGTAAEAPPEPGRTS